MNGNGQSNGLPKTADVVILGAGVMGASIAFHLAKRKAGTIVVLRFVENKAIQAEYE